MDSTKATAPRRVRVPGKDNAGVYQRPDGRYEIGFRDSTGRQRWRGPFDTVTHARAERHRIAGAKANGERIQPNPKLKFGEAADRWLEAQVALLRPRTQVAYRGAIESHLRPRWGHRRLEAIDTDAAARLVAELRQQGLSEWTIVGVLTVAGRVFAFAQRRCCWHGRNPVAELEKGERPKTSQTARRRIFQGDELAATIRAARDPFRLMFTLAATTGARLSELLGLVWSDVDLADTAEATVTFEYQADLQGQRVALKTEEAQRTVEIPRQLAALLLEHKARSPYTAPSAFVFCTRSGRAIGQRNVLRELRRAMTAAVDEKGRPAFPVLHEIDENGKPKPVARGAVPNFHGFRHTAASEAIAAGDGAEEVSWQLGHRNSNVTRAIYVQEIKSAERRARRRARLEARYGALLDGSTGGSNGPQQAAADVRGDGANVLSLRAIEGAAH